MSEYKFERCSSELDLDRCQGIDNKTGQCMYKAIPGTLYCPRHGGNKTVEAQARTGLKQYRLTQYKERVADFANNPDIKSLREEIGIVRMVLEKILNGFKSDNELLIYSDKISLLVSQVRSLIESCQKLEEKNNKLLDRNVVLVLADSIVKIVGSHIDDPDKLNDIGAQIVQSIATIASPTDSIGSDT